MTTSRMAVLVVCDSLRADLVDDDAAPTLARLRREATSFEHFRSVFPSTTRTSAASIATGCRPASHGLLGNTMVLDEGEGLRCFSVGAPDFLDRLRRATGRALLRPTLHERVAALGAGVAMSNVSPGAAYVLDPEGAGFVYHRAGSFGPGREPLQDGLAIRVGAAGDREMTQRFVERIYSHRPPYAVLWLSEPDHTGHHAPLGSPEHRAAIREADANVERVLQAVREIDPSQEDVLFMACSDHGMQTIRRSIDVDGELVRAGFKESAESADLVIAPQGTSFVVHIAERARDRLPALVAWLRERDYVGQVLAGQELSAIGLPQGPSLCVAVSLATEDVANEFGVRGFSDIAQNPFGGESLPGHGQHGGLGPYEQRPFLVASGGGFAPGRQSEPASLIDLAATVLRHLGLPVDGVEGRPLQRA
jgi:arylsulfatase A-like enzyme